MSPRRRLDQELVARALAPDEAEAAALIAARRILVSGSPGLAPARLVHPAEDLAVLPAPKAYVSRGGEKLAGALIDLGVTVAGRRCLDAGAGTGGFTDCLLQHGAASVVAVDVGYGDVAWRLRTDPRVRLVERTNLRTLDPAALGGLFDLVVADLSFISLASVVPVLAGLAGPGADLLVLVKPQFEAPRSEVPAGGVVVDEAVWEASVARVRAALAAAGWGDSAVAPSRLRGAAGNQEFFARARRAGA